MDTAEFLLAIGTKKGLWVARSRDRVTWTLDEPRFLMQEIPSVAIDVRGASPRLMVGVRSEHWGPTVARSDDLGATWVEDEHGAIAFDPQLGVALERIWQIQPDLADRPGVVWAGCEPTSLWRSSDGGESFSLVRGLWDHPHRPDWTPGFGGAAVHSIAPDPRDAAAVTVAMSTGGVYQSSDDAASFEPRNVGIKAYFFPDPWPEYGQCVHKIARDSANPDRLYAQNHHGVYRSDDNTVSWSSIAAGLPSDFGFVMLTHQTRGDTAWVVPIVADGMRVPPDHKLRVHRTDDGGATWQELGEGLPDQTFAIVLRDAAGVDAEEQAGIYLGTRDGCVYASADEGATFTTVAEHLPDVLSVRAARVRGA